MIAIVEANYTTDYTQTTSNLHVADACWIILGHSGEAWIPAYDQLAWAEASVTGLSKSWSREN